MKQFVEPFHDDGESCMCFSSTGSSPLHSTCFCSLAEHFFHAQGTANTAGQTCGPARRTRVWTLNASLYLDGPWEDVLQCLGGFCMEENCSTAFKVLAHRHIWTYFFLQQCPTPTNQL